MESQPLGDWETNLCDCFEETSTCCYGFWCCPCLACTVSGRFKENYCLPLCDILSPAIVTAFGIPLCAPPAGLSMRVAMRERFRIKAQSKEWYLPACHGLGTQGSICKDIAVSCFCSWCSWCQMHRELKRRKKKTTINVQSQAFFTVQPQPVMNMQPVVQMQPGFVNQPGFANQQGFVVGQH